MNVDEVIDAIKTLRKYGSETINIEAKSARGGYPNCLDTVSSFANYRGGIIIFGLSETENFTAEGVYDVAQLQARLVEDGKNCMTPAIHMDIVVFEFEGKMLVAAKVNELPQNEKPCYITSKGMDRGARIHGWAKVTNE